MGERQRYVPQVVGQYRETVLGTKGKKFGPRRITL